MIVQFPAPPPGNAFLSQLVESLRRAFASVVSKDQAVSRIILRSANGTTYAVTVADNGSNLTLTAIDGKTRDI